MSVSRTGNNTFNVQGTEQSQRVGCSPKMKKLRDVTGIIVGAGTFIGGFAIASSGM